MAILTTSEGATSTAIKPGRVPELDGLRAFAILPVILNHCYPFDGFFGWIGSFGKAGAMGVDLFFVLSGYLITGILVDSVGRPNYYRNFVIRRSLRIFPLYYLCLLLFTAAAWASGGQQWADMKQWGIDWFVVYLGNFRVAWVDSFPPVSSYGPLWSLQVEEQFYLLYPLAVVLLSRRNLWRFLVGCIVAAPLIRMAVVLLTGGTNSHALYVLTPCRMDTLAAGGLVALLARSPSDALPSRRNVRAAVVLLGLAVVAMTVWKPQLMGMTSLIYHQVIGYSIVAIAFACLIAMIVLYPPKELGRVLRWRALVYTGQIAYGLYLVHAPMSWIARTLIKRVFGIQVESHSALSLPITFFVSYVAAALSWRYFETPILAWKERLAPSATGVCPVKQTTI